MHGFYGCIDYRCIAKFELDNLRFSRIINIDAHNKTNSSTNRKIIFHLETEHFFFH